ncbi:MAG TPA: amino acid adenylation domain-containing protein, partial [Longimicrobiaceae bacterium]|nr:amino acid adenylation domain-containing protein [Longimicrobiaceae bacterium]
GRVRETALGAYTHQELPFERLVEELGVERSLAHAPLFQATCALERAGGSDEQLRLGELAVEPFGAGDGVAKYDLELTFRDSGDVLSGELIHRAALFAAETAARMTEHLQVLLEAMASDPERRLSEVPLLRGAERAQVLESWNDTRADYPAACVHELVSAQAARTPGAVAVVFEDCSLTYAELDARSDALAGRLQALGVGPETRVGVCAERSAELVVALLGALKAGGAYVPLDPGYPAERLAYMLADSGVPVLLTQTHLQERLPQFAGEVVLLDASPDERTRYSVLRTSSPENLAYVIYTSGSTGRPKGAMNAHRGVVNRLLWMQAQYGLTCDDVVLQKTPFSFDVSVWEFFWPLLAGARLVLARPEGHRDPAYLAELIERERVTTLHFVPPMLQAFLEAGEPARCGSVRRVVCSGEALPYELTERFRAALPGAELHNLYGPTEAAVDVTYWACAPNAARVVLIGRPVANTRLYVLDGAGEPTPVGVPGELFLGGVQVGRGYLGRPELTAERFVPDPFSATGARLYRTGDRARWTAAGEVEYLGRTDFQVKVRGFRIELGEVEAALREHAAVREAVVLAREQRLVAYVVPAAGVQAVGAELLRAHLSARLPEHMAPGAYMLLEQLPLTANGKLDRRALPAPEWSAAAYVSPRTLSEELLSGIWAEVLRLERVGVEENFFELGGHSLLATRVVSRIREVFGVEVPLRALFEAPTVAALGARIEALRSESTSPVPPIVRVQREGPLPLSFAQQRLWVVDRLDPGSAAYNMPSALRLRGALDVAALQASLDELVRRHETLRTTFAERDGAPVQIIHPPAPVPLAELDLQGVPEAKREAERLAVEDAMRPFDLARGPLLRSTLIRLAEDDHVLCFNLHHVVSDGWSMQVLVREVSALYAAFSRGEAPQLPELPVQYADFAVWQRSWLSGAVLDAQIGYWRERLGGAPPLLEIPVDRPRVPVQSPRAESRRIALPPGLSRELREISREAGVTLFMTLLAGWQALLARYAGQDDVVVGSPVAGRNRRETEGLIGFFVNMLPLRSDLSGDPTWHELLGRTRDAALGAYDHQELPFERLVDELSVERSLTHSPVFQTVFTLSQAAAGEGPLELGELVLEPFGTGERVAKFDLDLALEDSGHVIGGALVYRPALFEAESIARMAGHLETLLEALAADPQRRLSELSLLRETERAQLLAGSRAEPVDHPPACVHELFSAQAARTPGLTAVSGGGQALSYTEVERRANRLAHHLRGRGVGPETRVGICLERGADMVVAVLGVLKAGGAYVPLDPAYPAERLAYTLADSGASVLLSHSQLLEKLPAFTGDVVRLDRDRAALEAEPDGAPRSEVGPRNAAYVIYTSGSTGMPKGVVVEHASLANTLLGTHAVFGLAPGEVMPALASYAFDIWGFEVFTPLLSGGEVRLLPRETVQDVERLVDELADADAVHAVPALMREVVARVQTGPGTLPRMRRVYVGGDTVPPDLIGQMRRAFPAAQPWVLYGPTEASILGSSARLRPEGGYAWQVLGRALPGVGLYVCDTAGGLLPAGVSGELWIGGAGVARGYLGRPELTGERFVPDAFSGETGARLYRTGDRVRRRADGELEFLGRVDQQVKIRGFRIEPGEVESALLAQQGVHEAVVIVRDDAAGQKRLVGYVVPKEGAELSVPALKVRLQE